MNNQTTSPHFEMIADFSNFFDVCPLPLLIVKTQSLQIVEANKAFLNVIHKNEELANDLNKISLLDMVTNPKELVLHIQRSSKSTLWSPLAVSLNSNYRYSKSKRVMISGTGTLLKNPQYYLLFFYEKLDFGLSWRERLEKIEEEKYASIIESEEHERERYAKELHDGLGPLLSTTMIYLHTVRKNPDGENSETYLKRMEELLQDAIQSTREISANLSSNILRKYGLAEALMSFIDKLRDIPDIDFMINNGTVGIYKNVIGFTVYRCLTELINNSIKHAQAKKIRIDLSDDNGRLKVVFQDDGIGFDYHETLKNSSGSGLSNIKSRVKKVGGWIRFKTNPDEGTRVIISIKNTL